MSDQAAVRRAIAQGAAFQRQYGRAPGIIIRRHHDHVNAMYSPKEMSHSGWPICLRCRRIVEGYGVAHDGDTSVEVEAECHGEKTSYTVRKPYRDVLKAEPNWLTEVISMLTFFAAKESEK